MLIIRKKKILRNLLDKNRIKNKIAFIPTMGSIHEGHLSLLKKSKKKNCISCVSIFINPTQFNNKKDFKLYPKNERKDLKLLKENGCDIVFLPGVKEVYPNDVSIKRRVRKYRNILCDKFRPNHFDGVVEVIRRLFKLVEPNIVFLGEKDFQQLKIIQTLSQQLKLNIIIHACPSVRLQNGMSLSSRFNNFSANDKKVFDKCAYQISLLIIKLKEDINKVNLADYKSILQLQGVKKIEYLEIRDEENLSFSKTCNKSRLFIATYVGDVRVIDNFILY